MVIRVLSKRVWTSYSRCASTKSGAIATTFMKAATASAGRPRPRSTNCTWQFVFLKATAGVRKRSSTNRNDPESHPVEVIHIQCHLWVRFRVHDLLRVLKQP